MPTTATTFETFERLKAKGVSAYKKGDWAEAQAFLTQAAESMAAIAEQDKDDTLRAQHVDLAEQLASLARQCSEMKSKPKKASSGKKKARSDSEDDDGGNAEDWVVREKPDVCFDDIAGLEDVKDEIRLKMIYPLQYGDAAEEYGLSVGGGLLLYGPPGTGKTMIAKAVAREIDATFFVVSSADILSKWVGEAEGNIRKLFDAAKAEDKAVIFIDEIEAMTPRRTSSGSTVMQRVVPQILQELEGFDRSGDQCLLFIGATNKPWMLDEAMMRPGRFDTKAYLGLPDSTARMRMLDIYFGHRPLDEGVDLARICELLEGFSGADIKCLSQKSATIPFMDFVKAQTAAAANDQSEGEGDRRPISMTDILTVLEGMRPSVSTKDLARYQKFMETGG